MRSPSLVKLPCTIVLLDLVARSSSRIVFLITVRTIKKFQRCKRRLLLLAKRKRGNLQGSSGYGDFVTLAEACTKSVRDVIVRGVVPRIWVHCLKEAVTPASSARYIICYYCSSTRSHNGWLRRPDLHILIKSLASASSRPASRGSVDSKRKREWITGGELCFASASCFLNFGFARTRNFGEINLISFKRRKPFFRSKDSSLSFFRFDRFLQRCSNLWFYLSFIVKRLYE